MSSIIIMGYFVVADRLSSRPRPVVFWLCPTTEITRGSPGSPGLPKWHWW